MTGRWVLFVSHDAGRTGAVISLLHLVRWVAANTAVPFRTLFRQGGEMRDSFAAVGPTADWHVLPAGGRLAASIAGRPGGRRLAGLGRAAKLRAAYGRQPPALVFSNTVTNGPVLEAAAAAWGCPIVTYAHELGHWIAHRTDPAGFAATLRLTSHFLAASEAVRHTLTADHGVRPDRVDVVYEMVRRADVAGAGPGARDAVRAELGLPGDALVVGGSGTLDWRKGPDLFVQVASAVRRRRPDAPVHFVWVGGSTDGLEFHQLAHDARQAGVGDRVRFIGSRADPARYFAAFDVFALTSREDPFPLVCIEAAAAGCPVVCFAGAGGAPEFVAGGHEVPGGHGFVAPYLDVDAMASRVIQLYDQPDLRREVGGRAATSAVASYDVDVVAPRIMATIDRYLRPSPAEGSP